MRAVRRKAAVALLLVALLGSGRGLAARQDALAGFDAYVSSGLDAWRIPGLAVAVVKDGRVVHLRGYGVRELGRPERVDEHTLFAIGSTTKAMTAALVGMLVDEQKLAWDDPVTRHLPSFQLRDPAVTRELTVRDLLTHRAGLGNADFLWYGQEHTTADILQRVRLLEPAYSLRSRFIYQNVMYAAAGQVIEQVTGQSWADVIRTRIFEPLGMRDSRATLRLVPRDANVAAPHAVVAGRVKVVQNMSVDSVAAAGSVWSSARDMSLWLQFVLAGGHAGGAGGKRLLSERTYAELFRPQAFVPDTQYPTTQLVKPHWMTYGLGWFQQDYRGRAVDFHTGSIDGMIAIAGLVRDERLGVLVLGNLSGGELRHALMYDVFDRYAGTRDRDWSAALLKLYGDIRDRQAQAQARTEAQRVTGTAPSRPLQEYAGTYIDPLRGTVVVSADGDGLTIRYGTAFSGVLEHWHYNTFRAVWAADWRGTALVNFTLAPATGRPESLEFQGARFVRTAAGERGTRQDDQALPLAARR
ncbi:MAG TPA: serine hydrolase [Vicinamibacterales bacterium]|nr:serine hydrolase [Vicinamibacterales bacterium]